MIDKNDNARGVSREITMWGDSMTQGAGADFGQSVADWLKFYLPDRLIHNHGIGGQNSGQILARQGSNPIKVTLAGAINNADQIALSITPDFLSTPADTINRLSSGRVMFTRLQASFNGSIPLLIKRTGSTNVYTAQGLGKVLSGTVPANAVFIPDEGHSARHHIQTLWVGRNDSPTFANVEANIDRAVDYLLSPKRFLIVGIMPLQTEVSGTEAYKTITALNKRLEEKYEGRYVSIAPPTAEELASVNVVPTNADKSDMAKGIFPLTMYYDNAHLIGVGYRIIAMRMAKIINSFNW